MRVPIEWLKEYVEFSAAPEELADKLTFSGLEVEGIETVESEPVLDVEVTPNRPDCMSIIGVAREVAALFGSKLTLPSVKFSTNKTSVSDLTSVEIQDTGGCPRYTARVLQDVCIGQSPDWMRKRLVQCGVNPINNVVDITNYVLMECGHPLHAFDKLLLNEERIIVRKARNGEKVVTLDGTEHKLADEMLVIADAAAPVAVAGVMGGASSEIRESTGTVLLESAYFHPVGIRRTSKQLGLATESSVRFERGADVGVVDWASKRAAGLMVELADAKVCDGVIDVFPEPPSKREIKLRFARACDLIGVDIKDNEISSILESLGLTVSTPEKGSCVVAVPTFRVDLEEEADLVEEVARIHGLDKIPDDEPSSGIVREADDAELRAVSVCRSNLVGLGLCEILNYSFTSDALLDLFDAKDRDARISLLNPASASHAVLRTSLLPQMVESLGRNLAHQVEDVSFFEPGRVFFKDANGAYREEDRLSIGLMGWVGGNRLERKGPVTGESIFLWLKGIIEALCLAQHLDNLQFKDCEHPCLEDGTAVSVMIDGGSCGVAGLVKGRIRKEWRMTEPVAVAEMALVPVLRRVFDVHCMDAIPAYPSIARDIAMVVDENVTHEQIMRAVLEEAPVELTKVELFDIFRKGSLGAGKKSLAYSIVYRSSERTLTDEEANMYHENIKKVIRKELNAEIRES
jgi:phenylalanyl-tRNA synthetase beta chain